MKAQFKISGVPELLKKMEALGPELSTKAGQSATRAGIQVVATAMRQHAPVGDDDTSRTYTVKGGSETRTVDYGHLRDNIRVKKVRARKQYTVVSRVTTMHAFWGRMLEFGTEKMAAHPWAKPAVDSSHNQAVTVMMEALNKALTRFLRRSGRA